MNISYLDIIFFSLAVLLLAASFLFNFLSSGKIKRLAQSIGQLEEHFEERISIKKRRVEANRPDSDSKEKYFDSSILPAAEKKPDEPSTRLRYRPPSTSIINSSAQEPSENGNTAEERTPATLEGEDILIVKNTRKRAKSQEMEKLSDEEKALLETYLGEDSQIISSSLQQKTAATETRNTGNGRGGEDEELLEEAKDEVPVPVQDSRVETPAQAQDSRVETPAQAQDSRVEAPAQAQDSRVEAAPPAVPLEDAKKDGGHTDLEISPLNESNKTLDLDQVRSALDSVQPQGRLVLNMEGLSNLSERELGALNVVWRKTTAKQVQMVFKNLPPRLREEVSEYIPRVVFLP